MFTASSVSTLRRIWGHEEKDVSKERKKGVGVGGGNSFHTATMFSLKILTRSWVEMEKKEYG